MKKIRSYALFWMLVLSVMLAMAAGGYLQEKGLSRGETRLEALMRYPETLERSGDTAAEPTQTPTMEAVTEPSTEPSTEPETEPSTEPSTEPETQPSTEATEPQTELTEPEPTEPLAIYGEDESYFDDALFIGDSRTDGLRLYCPIGDASYFCTTGMTIFDTFDVTAPNRDLVEQSLEQVLREREFGKIYITLGLNELSASDIVLKAEYELVINRIRQNQPEAKIFLNAIMPLGREKTLSQNYFAMERIAAFNQVLQNIAGEMECVYLDASPVFAGEDGYLREELSYDGCHLYARNYWMWAQFLCENAA